MSKEEAGRITIQDAALYERVEKEFAPPMPEGGPLRGYEGEGVWFLNC